jgi:hypothetical protein
MKTTYVHPITHLVMYLDGRETKNKICQKCGKIIKIKSD